MRGWVGHSDVRRHTLSGQEEQSDGGITVGPGAGAESAEQKGVPR